MRIPTDASPGLQRAFKELSDRLDRLGASTAGTSNLNLRGQRATNAGKAEDLSDYVTLEQVTAMVQDAVNTVRESEAQIRGKLLNDLAVAAHDATAPAALANVPDWLAAIFDAVR